MLFNLINEMCDEVRKKADTDWGNIIIERWSVGWQVRKDVMDEEDKKAPALRVHAEENNEDKSFSTYSKVGFCFGVSTTNIETSYEKYKRIKILMVRSVAEGKYTQLRTNIYWYDRLRPTWWKMNRTIKYVRRLRVSYNAYNIEKDLAKMIPDRIDNILLGGMDDKT